MFASCAGVARGCSKSDNDKEKKKEKVPKRGCFFFCSPAILFAHNDCSAGEPSRNPSARISSGPRLTSMISAGDLRPVGIMVALLAKACGRFRSQCSGNCDGNTCAGGALFLELFIYPIWHDNRAVRVDGGFMTGLASGFWGSGRPSTFSGEVISVNRDDAHHLITHGTPSTSQLSIVYEYY